MKLNKILSIMLITILISFNIITSVYAFSTYYKKEISTKIINGVDYERDIYLTDQGWLNVHVLKVDYSKDYIDVVPLYSKDVYGKRDTITNMMKDKPSYIAGVNADFFDMRSNLSYPIGTLVEDGKLLATSNVNEGCNNYATVFLTKDSPFIDFFDVNMKFYANDNLIFNIKHLNKITNFDVPVVIDNSNLMKDTNEIDALYKGLYKIVVENNVITKFSTKGEVVKIPENGYVIVMKEKAIFEKSKILAIGQNARLDINTSINTDKVKYAISGSVKILENGQVVNRGVPNTGKNPRTAIGITKDNKIILLAIDGRSNESIGVTHEELATLIESYGAYNALNFDGGGSTTMVLKSQEGTLDVINKVSDGTQRKVINGLAVVNNSKVGDAKEMHIHLDKTEFVPNQEITLSVTGHDEFGNVSNPNIKNVKWAYSGVKGKIVDNKFTSQAIGKCKITATYGNTKAETEIEITDKIGNLKFDIDKVVLDTSKTVNLMLKASSEDGQNIDVDMKKVKWQLSTKNLGSIKSNVFKAGTKSAEGYITATYKDKTAIIPVVIGVTKVVVNNFDDLPNKSDEKITFSSDSEKIVGSVTNTTKNRKSGKSIELKYTFEKSDSHQAAYINFGNPIEITDKVQAIGLDLYGDRSNNMFKAKIIDATNKEYSVLFTDNINWSGYKYVSGQVDRSMVYPIKIESIYAVTLNKYKKATKTIYIDNLCVVKMPDISGIKIPTLPDNMVSIENDPKEKSLDVLVLDGFDGYEISKQDNYINNIKSSYELVLTTDASEKVKSRVMANKIQNQNINYAVNNQNVQFVYLNADNKDMYKFLENSVKSSIYKNVVIVTNQIDNSKSDNKQTILKSILEEASASKNILVISNRFTEEAIKGKLKYLPINLTEAIKIKAKDGVMKYAYLK
ncbi:MAG: hypothetical protein A2Y24_03165 [Clostridiales bacterium GWE2_32_10]|nr:MAG: hypothetical protein A2Y24_03165 [Clostridiales bacterium GWE2_32_10]HBY19909.1 hypothetical protein [Clostridiales bacterium]